MFGEDSLFSGGGGAGHSLFGNSIFSHKHENLDEEESKEESNYHEDADSSNVEVSRRVSELEDKGEEESNMPGTNKDQDNEDEDNMGLFSGSLFGERSIFEAPPQ
jgi:hypothetical protein